MRRLAFQTFQTPCRCLASTVNISLAHRTFFHTTSSPKKLQPYLLADIGEGITECQIIQWLVKPGDSVQQFDPICEVQSDKATVEITSRYEGIIKKLHYEVDGMAAVGSPLLDIDIAEADGHADNKMSHEGSSTDGNDSKSLLHDAEQVSSDGVPERDASVAIGDPQSVTNAAQESYFLRSKDGRRPETSVPALPSVRMLLKEHELDIRSIQGTGKGGRILKEDVQNHLASRSFSKAGGESLAPSTATQHTNRGDTVVPLSPVQHHMLQVMTESLSIPHFLYSTTVDMTGLTTMRRKYASNGRLRDVVSSSEPFPKISALPFIIKAVSQALRRHPTLNSTLDLKSGPKPMLILRGSHNIGIAMDTPKGLIVPVIHNVENRSIMDIAAEVDRLSTKGKEGRLSPRDLKGATLVVSNIGSIGGHIVSPIIMSPMTVILGIGKSQPVAVFKEDAEGKEQIVKQEQAMFNWSADHRVLDGATVARCAEDVSTLLGNMEVLGLTLS